MVYYKVSYLSNIKFSRFIFPHTYTSPLSTSNSSHPCVFHTCLISFMLVVWMPPFTTSNTIVLESKFNSHLLSFLKRKCREEKGKHIMDLKCQVKCVRPVAYKVPWIGLGFLLTVFVSYSLGQVCLHQISTGSSSTIYSPSLQSLNQGHGNIRKKMQDKSACLALLSSNSCPFLSEPAVH